MLLGPIVGPILGGWLVDDVSWRWIFFINLPVGVATLSAALRILPRDTASPQHGFDALGLVLLSPGLAAMIYGLAQSHSAGGFDQPEVFGPVIAGVILYRHDRVYTLANEVSGELKKVTWPTAKEVRTATIVVLVMSIISAFILGLFDLAWTNLTELVYG